MPHVTILCGNPKAASRTLHIAQELVSQLFLPGSVELTVIDLAEHTEELFAWPSAHMSALSTTVAASELLVVCSPTYKASYTGLLKSFLDRYPAAGLKGVTAIGVMTGGDLTHAMGAEVNLRPLLVELGASVPTRSLYFVMSDMDRMRERIAEWVEAESEPLRGAAGIATALRAVEEVAS